LNCRSCETSVQTIIYDYADEKNVMAVAKITPKNVRHSSWTLKWFWSKITGSGFRPWEYFVKNKTKEQPPADKRGKVQH